MDSGTTHREDRVGSAVMTLTLVKTLWIFRKILPMFRNINIFRKDFILCFVNLESFLTIALAFNLCYRMCGFEWSCLMGISRGIFG